VYRFGNKSVQDLFGTDDTVLDSLAAVRLAEAVRTTYAAHMPQLDVARLYVAIFDARTHGTQALVSALIDTMCGSNDDDHTLSTASVGPKRARLVASPSSAASINYIADLPKLRHTFTDGNVFEPVWNSGKCIDATPLLIEDEHGDGAMVFIDSHSAAYAGLHCAGASDNWHVRWCAQLSDRVKASARATPCGRYVVAG